MTMVMEQERPRTSYGKEGSFPTEYQQFCNGTWPFAFSRPVDADLNQDVSQLYVHRIGAKKPILVSSTVYSECFKRPNSRESLAKAHYPFEASVYKRESATPKSHSHDQHRPHKSPGYTRAKKCEPEAHLAPGRTCDYWTSSYAMAHNKGATKKDKEKKAHRASKEAALSETDTSGLGTKDLWKMWALSSYELAYQPPAGGPPTSSQSSPFRASTAPGNSRQQFNQANQAHLPSMNAHSSMKHSDWNRSSGLHSSTPQLPAV